MRPLSPWLAVVVIVVGVVSAVLFAHYGVHEGEIPSTIVACGVAILWGRRAHVEGRELAQWRASGRPAAGPSSDPPSG